MRIEWEAEDRFGRSEGDGLDTADSGCFENIVCLTDVGVKDDVVGLYRQRRPIVGSKDLQLVLEMG